MKIFAISDLHMSISCDKPMNVFGGNWDNHMQKIQSDWQAKVSDEDLVLIPGDISWAMNLNEALLDLDSIKALPGKKIMIKGNHDYWWSSLSRLKEGLPEGFYALQNDAVRFDGVCICGSRGWLVPGFAEFKEHDNKLYLREAERLKLSLFAASKIKQDGDKLICMTHFPPFNFKKEDNLFTQIFEKNRVDKVVYGHLHGAVRWDLLTYKNDIQYYLTSCDKTDFKLTQIF